MMKNLSKLALVFIFIGWVFFGVGLFISDGTDEKTVTTQELCIDSEQGILKCGEQLFLEPQDTDTGRIWVNYNEATVKYVVCSFDSEGTFFCVNTKTGKVWVPVKKGVIV